MSYDSNASRRCAFASIQAKTHVRPNISLHHDCFAASPPPIWLGEPQHVHRQRSFLQTLPTHLQQTWPCSFAQRRAVRVVTKLLLLLKCVVKRSSIWVSGKASALLPMRQFFEKEYLALLGYLIRLWASVSQSLLALRLTGQPLQWHAA